MCFYHLSGNPVFVHLHHLYCPLFQELKGSSIFVVKLNTCLYFACFSTSLNLYCCGISSHVKDVAKHEMCC